MTSVLSVACFGLATAQERINVDDLKVVGNDMSADQIRQVDSQADEWMKKMKKIVGQ